jgi:hypothetical protein
VKDEMHKRISQRTTNTTMLRVFFSNLTTTGLSFAAALRGSAEQHQWPQTHQVTVAGPATMESKAPVPSRQHKQQEMGQPVGAPKVNSFALYNCMLRIITAVEKFITEFSGAKSEEEKILAITKIVLNLMKQNDS